MIYSYEYDTGYFGPALPVVEIEIAATDKPQNRLVLRGLVDSGADATMIPVRYLRQLDIRVVDRRRMRSSANVSYLVDIYAITFRLGPYEQAIMEVVGNRQSNDLIVGRDVLNYLIVTLNGLANVVEISQ